jgi:predicted nucleotidyltransferase
MTKYPTLSWVRSELRFNLNSQLRTKVLSAYIIGSYAKNENKKGSDLDIAVLVPQKATISSLKLTERYHSKFSSNNQMPRWMGVQVDFQFFYPDNLELKKYKKIKLE